MLHVTSNQFQVIIFGVVIEMLFAKKRSLQLHLRLLQERRNVGGATSAKTNAPGPYPLDLAHYTSV